MKEDIHLISTKHMQISLVDENEVDLNNRSLRGEKICLKHRRPKLTIGEIDRINDLCKRMNNLCKRMSDLCKPIEWDVTT